MADGKIDLNAIRKRARELSSENAIEDREALLEHLDKVINSYQARVSGLFFLAEDLTKVGYTALWATARSKLQDRDPSQLKHW